MNLYRFFSLLFSYPTEESRRELASLAQSGNIPRLRSAEALSFLPLETAQTEYTRLFVSAYPSLLCPPYESFYRQGILYGNSSVEVGEWYRKSGFDFIREGEPPDLLSAELEFLALANEPAFLARMKEWIFDFTARVREYSSIYGPCAGDLEDFIKQGGRVQS